MLEKLQVLAIFASPNPKLFTDKILNLFLEGIGENIELHKFYPHRMKINYCTDRMSFSVDKAKYSMHKGINPFHK